MFYQSTSLPPQVTVSPSEVVNPKTPQDHSSILEVSKNLHLIATPSRPEILLAELSTVKEVVNPTVITPNTGELTEKNSIPTNNAIESKNLLLGVSINGQEVGNIDVIKEDNSLLIPLADFAQIAGFTIETKDNITEFKTPLGSVKLPVNNLKKINGIIYISDALLREKLLTNLELKSTDLTLIVDLPWRRNNGQSSNKAIDLQPEVKPYGTGLSNLRQELTLTNNSAGTSWQSSSLLGGRLAGGAWRLRLENNFISSPNVSEYFFFKRSGQFLYQLGRQQIGLHPLLTNINLTGAQLGFTNLPADRFNTNYGASELLPRRSQPIQTFRGVVPPASFIQLRISGVVVSQQQVGLDGVYEFHDINLPSGQSNNIELLVFDRNNLNIPTEVRSIRLNASDLLLPSGGNIQLGGLGVTGSLIQDSLFNNFADTQSGKPAAFYQLRQGLTNNLTFEGGVQVLSDTTQAQGGFIWRLANPLILATSVGTSHGVMGYTADLNFQLNRLQIVGNSQSFPTGYFSSSNNAQAPFSYDHSLDVQYRFSQNFNLGFIARSRQNQPLSLIQNQTQTLVQNSFSNYILPTFSLRPFSTLSLRGGPDINGLYSFNGLFQPTTNSRFSFNSFGNIYTTNFAYDLSRRYQIGFDTESGGNLDTRYTVSLSGRASSIFGLNWRLGMAYRGGEFSPSIGANMRIVPGLSLSVDYQGIPSRYKSIYGGLGDDHLTVLLVSDLSFAGGKVAPAEYSTLSRDKGAIAGQVLVPGGRKGLDLHGAMIQVFNTRNQNVGSGMTDPQGNFFVGNLPEGIYVVQLDLEELPVEIAAKKTSVVAEVANSAITKLDFPVQLEYGLAGRITDSTGKPIPNLELELVNTSGKKVAGSTTNEFGLYRLDGVITGQYKLQVPEQDHLPKVTLPTREVNIGSEFLYDQNLQLPISE